MTLAEFASSHADADLFIGRNGHPGQSFEGLSITVDELSIGDITGTVEDDRWNWNGTVTESIRRLPHFSDIYKIRAN